MKTSDVVRFMSKVNTQGTQPNKRMPHYARLSPCWEWSASKSKDGYGYFGYGKKVWKAHRVAYDMFVGSIPEGLKVLHRCDNPACVNPSHLHLGTQSENNKDAKSKGRSRSCPPHKHWAKLHPERRLFGDRNSSRTHPEKLKRGEDSTNSKLTEACVRSIRQEYGAGGCSQYTLATKYGVSRCAIKFVLQKKTWKHVV